MPTYRTLQAARAVAAVLVVLFHLGGSFASERYFGIKAFDLPFAWADAGVDFFFVLSGFIITAMHRRDFGQGARLLPYLRKRALRIYPTYWMVCLLVLLAALAVPSLRHAIESAPLTALLSLLLVPQDPAVVGGTGATILFVAWSLQYEVLFYLLFALFIVNRPLGVLAVLLLALNMLGCGLDASGCGFARSFLASPYMLLFAVGVGCAYATHPMHSRLRLPGPGWIAALGLAGFFGFGLFETLAGRSLPPERHLVYGLLAGVTVIGLVQAEREGLIVLRSRLLALVGDASYSLYLLHIPVISLACKFLLAAGIDQPALLVPAFALTATLCVVVAVVFYRLVERPVLALLQHKPPPAALPVRRAMRRAHLQ